MSFFFGLWIGFMIGVIYSLYQEGKETEKIERIVIETIEALREEKK